MLQSVNNHSKYQSPKLPLVRNRLINLSEYVLVVNLHEVCNLFSDLDDEYNVDKSNTITKLFMFRIADHKLRQNDRKITLRLNIL